MKKILVTLFLIVALGCTLLTGCNFTLDVPKEESASVVTLDVNPGMRIYLSADDKVIALEATNSDGTTVTEELESEVKGEDLDTAVDTIVDDMFERGYLGDDSNSVLISIEKDHEDIETKIREKIQKRVKEHGKEACVVSQEMSELAKETREQIKALAEEYGISEGKAHIIEKIREVYPEAEISELVGMRMNELALMLEDMGEELGEHIKKHGEAMQDKYVGGEAAFETALTDAGVSAEDVLFKKVHIDREDGKMVYEVEFVTETLEYEYEIDAESGEILDKETEEFEMPDIDKEIEDFFDKHGDKLDEYFNGKELPFDKEDLMNGFMGGHGGHGGAEKPEHVGRTEILKTVIEALGITRENIEDTKVRRLEGKERAIVSVEIELKSGEKYSVTAEAHTGIIIEAKLNGTVIELPTAPETGTKTTPGTDTETTPETEPETNPEATPAA